MDEFCVSKDYFVFWGELGIRKKLWNIYIQKYLSTYSPENLKLIQHISRS